MAYGELPAEHRAAHEAEKAAALANARARAPGQQMLQAEQRGLETGYQGAKNKNSLVLNYDVPDSVIQVGEYAAFAFNISTPHDEIRYTITGKELDENFQHRQNLFPEGDRTHVINGTAESGTYFAYGYRYQTKRAGYIYFVITVSDSNGNVLAFTTPTIQVYAEKEPAFDNIGMDTVIGTNRNLGVRLTMDRVSATVGDEITAAVTMSTKLYPIEYTANWKHIDAEGNELVVERYEGTVSHALDANSALTFPYQPLYDGQVQFMITATDGDGNIVQINNPLMTVEDGYYVILSLNTNVINVGGKARATYRIQGHECDEGTSYRITWRSYAADASISDAPMDTQVVLMETRSGSNSYAPRVGQNISCVLDVSCKHTVEGTVRTGYAEAKGITLVGGMNAELALTASTVASGQNLTVLYSLEGGMAPYRSVTVNGYSTNGTTTYQFLSTTVTEDEGTVTGTPYLGTQAYYEIVVVESDGYTTTWQSEKIPLTGAPHVSLPVLTASLSKDAILLGEAVSVTYRMTDGAGMLSPDGDSFLRWKKSDGTVVKEVRLNAISGTHSYQPTEDGEYQCEIRLKDAYNQTITWVSGPITVGGRLPGDVNLDGVVNATDAALIMQHGAGWRVVISRSNADVDASGAVNIQDALLILKFVSGQSVTLK